MFPPRNCHPLITNPPNQTQLAPEWQEWHNRHKTQQSCQHIQMEGKEGSRTRPLFSCCHRTHMRTFHVFFLRRVSRGLQLICVIASHTHTLTHTLISILTPPPSHSFNLQAKSSRFHATKDTHIHKNQTCFVQDSDRAPTSTETQNL